MNMKHRNGSGIPKYLPRDFAKGKVFAVEGRQRVYGEDGNDDSYMVGLYTINADEPQPDGTTKTFTVVTLFDNPDDMFAFYGLFNRDTPLHPMAINDVDAFANTVTQMNGVRIGYNPVMDPSGKLYIQWLDPLMR